MSTLVVGEHPLAAPLCAALSSLGGAVRHEPAGRDPTGADSEPWPDWAQARGAAPGSPSETAQNALVAGVETVVLLPVDHPKLEGDDKSDEASCLLAPCRAK